jgi:cytochrome P450
MARTVLPPGPRGHFLTGHLSELKRDWLGSLTRYAREHGDVVALRLGSKQAVLISHPELIKSVLIGRNREFTKSALLRDGRRLFGNGLIMSGDDFWRRQRKMIQPGFHRERVMDYSRTMVGYTQQMLDGWHDGQRREIHSDLMALTLRIVCRTLFGADATGLTERVEAATTTAARHFSERTGNLGVMLPESLPLPANVAYLRAAQELDDIILGIIDRRRRSGEDPDDLLSMMLTARDDLGRPMTDEQLRDEMMTLFLAGHETTAAALSWVFWLLGQHPRVEERLLAELDSELGGRPATAEDLPALPYADAVVAEALRLYPPIWALARETIEPCEVGGYQVPAESLVITSQWVVHRDRRWFHEPLAFRPERWLGGQTHRTTDFTYFPFGGGARQCIGLVFARVEALLVLAAIAPRFHLELDPNHSVVPWPSVTLRPRGGVRVILRQRH